MELRENAIPKKPRTYRKLDISFPISEELDDAINKFMNHINYEDGRSEDCYRSEVEFFLKDSFYFAHSLSEEHYDQLFDYYVSGGIYKENGFPWIYDKSCL